MTTNKSDSITIHPAPLSPVVIPNKDILVKGDVVPVSPRFNATSTGTTANDYQNTIVQQDPLPQTGESTSNVLVGAGFGLLLVVAISAIRNRLSTR